MSDLECVGVFLFNCGFASVVKYNIEVHESGFKSFSPLPLQCVVKVAECCDITTRYVLCLV